ncbi:MAG TPA: hypothetical protein VHV51_24320 [Polyangiaceae bacterium]|jgi:hypothetical protein|nr:hypothetical protein [Polyangiaceae bacterium]
MARDAALHLQCPAFMRPILRPVYFTLSLYSLFHIVGCTAEVRPETPHEARQERREERHEEHVEHKEEEREDHDRGY